MGDHRVEAEVLADVALDPIPDLGTARVGVRVGGLAVEVREAADQEPPVRALLEVLVAPARVDEPVGDPLRQRRGRRHVEPARAHARRVLGHESGKRTVRGHHHVARGDAARRRAQVALAGRRHGALDRRAIVDARAGRLRRARERADPASGLERAVVLGQAAVQRIARHRRRQLAALDELAREAVLAERLGVARDVVGLLLGCAHAQQAHAAHRLARSQFVRQLVHTLLRLERGRVHAARRLAAVALARVRVEGRHSGQQEAAVAAARAAGDRVALEHQRVDAGLRERQRARQAPHACADHADLRLHAAVERGPRLVGLVEPVGNAARAAQGSSPASTARACSL